MRDERAVPVEICHCLAIRKATRQITQYYDDKLAPSGVRTTQFSILQQIDVAGEITISALAVLLDLDRTTAARNLQLLERTGLIAIGRSRKDARFRTISLTPEGDATLSRAAPLWREAQDGFERSNGGGRLAAFRSALAALRFSEE